MGATPRRLPQRNFLAIIAVVLPIPHLEQPVRSLFSALLLVVACSTAWAQAGSPAGAVSVARLEARRAALAKRLGNGVAVLRSSTERSIEGDYAQDSDYREDNDFFYLTGAEAPESWLVLVARDSALAQVILYLPTRDTVTKYKSEQWVGARLNPGPAATALTGIQDVRASDLAAKEIPALVLASESPARHGMLYVKPGRDQDESATLRDSILAPAKAAGDIRIGNLSLETAPLRLVKDDDELTRLRRAIALTTSAEREAMATLKPEVYEYAVEALIEYTFRKGGAERLGFPSIVGSGPNSVALHYDKNRRRMESGDVVVMDIGAEFGYLTADVTRTAPVSGTFTARQRAIYRLVLATQQTAIDSVRPGMDIPRLNQIARAYMQAHSDTLCGAVTCDKYFVHGLSHWLGMDVHDVGDIHAPLVPGMVLTVEPGIYLAKEGLGVRIEDDVLVTADGHEVLSAAAPRQPEEVEALVRRGRGR
ncbi:MAG TPA: aminopeptidase P N-terminal domain-containing protein [Gemmatimonadales bacterium]|nr:aminopeptidase P N-terminal domain-containing protein [Gemmatimonadales bacterium]